MERRTVFFSVSQAVMRSGSFSCLEDDGTGLEEDDGSWVEDDAMGSSVLVFCSSRF